MKIVINAFVLAVLVISSSAVFAGEIYVISNVDSIDEISNKQLKELFLSTSPHFDDGTKAKPYDSADNRVFRAFYKAIAGKSRLQVKTYWSEMTFSGKGLPPKIIRSQSRFLEEAERVDGFIGYTTTKPTNKLKILKVIHY